MTAQFRTHRLVSLDSNSMGLAQSVQGVPALSKGGRPSSCSQQRNRCNKQQAHSLLVREEVLRYKSFEGFVEPARLT